MEKIINYIKSGKGKGLLFLLATALIITIFWMFLLKQIYNDIKPQLLQAAETVLPITIENSQITSPLDTYKRIDIMFGEKEDKDKTFPIILDTRDEPENLNNIPFGLLINKHGATLKIPPETRRLVIQDGTITKADAEEFLDYFSGASSLILSFLITTMLCISLFIKTILSAVLGKYCLPAILKDNPVNFSIYMRLCAILVSVTEIIFLSLSFGTGIRIGIIPQTLIVLLLSHIFFQQQKTTEK